MIRTRYCSDRTFYVVRIHFYKCSWIYITSVGFTRHFYFKIEEQFISALNFPYNYDVCDVFRLLFMTFLKMFDSCLCIHVKIKVM